ncbi:MAG: response regulator [Roseibacillus sp.]
MDEADKWKKRLERERNARKEAERLLEVKSLELFEANNLLEQQVAEKGSRLEVQEQRFTAIFEASMDGIVLLNKRSQIVEMNHTAEKMLGYPKERLSGKGVARIVSKEDWSIARNAFNQVRDTGYCRYEALLVRSDGTTFPTEIVGSRAKVGDDFLIQGIIRDISARKAAYQDLKLARIEAEKANEAKSLFLATMSHEIRTPLNGIIGFTDLVLNSDLTSEQKQNLEMVQRSGDILLHIINDILDFSRIESGKVELEEVDYELRDCLEEVLDLHAQTASSKGLELLYEIDPQIPQSLSGDVTRLRQVLMNLISNSLKFTATGTITTLVSLTEETIWIAVKDTGVGFDPSLAENLFQPFSQEDASTTRKFGGTGLGLAICRSLVERMGGTIKATSKEGQGAEFRFSLPLQAGQAIDTEEDTSTLFAAKHALIVDDNENNIIFLRKRLQYWGFSVSNASTGDEALQLASQEQFHVLLIDMMMPGMDGIELAGAVREFTQAPLVLVTSSRLTGDKERAYQEGFAKVLFKPLRQRELLKTLRSLVLGEKPTPSVSPPLEEKESSAKANENPLILIAEDNPINARLAALIVRSLNCRCQIAVNGCEALEMLKENSEFALIMMDMRMPEMDGLEATRLIRKGEAGESYREIPILAVTANALKSDEEACLEAGMTDYLAKPLRPNEVREKLTSLVLSSQ